MCIIMLITRNNARCTQARKPTHGLDGQHQDVDRTLRGRVDQDDRGQAIGASLQKIWKSYSIPICHAITCVACVRVSVC